MLKLFSITGPLCGLILMLIIFLLNQAGPYLEINNDEFQNTYKFPPFFLVVGRGWMTNVTNKNYKTLLVFLVKEQIHLTWRFSDFVFMKHVFQQLKDDDTKKNNLQKSLL